jgi:adenylylsulfate kinase
LRLAIRASFERTCEQRHEGVAIGKVQCKGYRKFMPAQPAVSRKRSLVKALTYRVAIVCLDFLAIYIFTRKVDVALGFMVVSNVYTTVGYFVHERIWAHIAWGTTTTAIASKT